MGREIRRVPEGWQHPTYRELGITEGNHFAPTWGRGIDEPHPLYDENFENAWREWSERCALWDQGKEESQLAHPEETAKYTTLHQWDGGPPDPTYYRHGKWAFRPEDATHYQLYSTVTEGSPKSPVFATLDELENWLVDVGGHTREAAHRFCETGWAPSGMVIPGVGVVTGIEACGILAQEAQPDGEERS